MKCKMFLLLTSAFCTIAFGAKALATTDSPVYRLYSAEQQVHFFTKNVDEVELLKTRGWRDEGVAWQFPSTGDSVYRLYNNNTKLYFYTKSKKEVELLVSRGWKDEGFAFNSSGSVPVYRMYNATLKRHFYTRSLDEYEKMSTYNYKKEGAAFYSKEVGADYFVSVQGTGRDRIHFIKKFNEANEFIILESNGRFALLDAGYQTESTKNYAVQYLKDLGVKYLDFIILSHYDEDHWTFINTQQTGLTSSYKWYGASRGVEESYLGSSELLDNFKIGKVIARPADPLVYYEPRVRAQIETTLQSYGIPIVYEQYAQLGDYSLSIFNDYPLSQNEKSQKSGAVSNYNSLTVLVEKDNYNFLFAGDLESDDEMRLASDLKDSGNPVMDLVTAGHHGLGTSNTKSYVDAIGNPVAIISYLPSRLDYKGRQNVLAYSQQLYSGLGTVVADFTDTSKGIEISQPDTGKQFTITNNRQEGVSW